MNPTKNVRYIEVEKDIFEQLCESKYDDKVRKVQEKYAALKQEVSGQITRWMKIKDKDCYLETKNKILFPDTRKMKQTDLRVHASDSYDGILQYLRECREDTLNTIREQADEMNMNIPTDFESVIAGLDAQPIDSYMVAQIFDDNTCPCMNGNGAIELSDKKACALIITSNSQKPVYSVINKAFYGCTKTGSALKISIHKFPSYFSPFELIVKYGLYPEKFESKVNEALQEFHEILADGIDIDNFDVLKSYLKNKKVEKILDIDLRIEAIENDIEAEEIDLLSDNEIGCTLKKYYDECDYIRARIQKYNSKWYLSDEGKGHWELWTEPEEQKNVKDSDSTQTKEGVVNVSARKKILRLKDGVIARNPIADVRHNSVVGIDFGTKSTIVALQDGDDQIIPLRVGMADYSVAPETSHFENPTVMQFVDLSHFIEQYNKAAGRPMTSWDDLLISHEAFKNLIESEKSTELVSFTTDLKQWAAGRYGNKSGGHLIIKDAKGNRYDIDNYMNLTSEDIDLIELYAYYIGLFINNMHTGIYLDYVLSFPETFSKEIKDHILQSFTKGIRKSIPVVVLDDAECSEEFRVRQGPSEPAAYAACALEQYGIEPTDEGIFYGIFDFGGGTTDYDYGIWKNAPEGEYTYNYVIKHYGSGGDRTLGGENILQLLAYNVFSDDTQVNGGDSNIDIMRKHKLVYYRPDDGKVYSGTEALNNDGESALLNTKLMMEALRPIWEEWTEVQQWFRSEKKKERLELSRAAKSACIVFDCDSSVKVNLSLFSETGREEVTLNVDMVMVNKVINDRIESGVRNFFEGLRQAYDKCEKKPSSRIHLFLAGNSSKSKRVMNLFKDYVVGYNAIMFEEHILESVPNENMELDEEKTALFNHINNILKRGSFTEQEELVEDEINKLNGMSDSHFVIYPPLGTEIARNIQRQKGIEIEENDLMAPTCKTGVAFGLVMCREGSMIKVESETKKSEQIKLNYYIGINYRKNFKMIFDRSSEYNKWLKFSKVAAESETFEFYYSELPEVVEGDIAIKDNKSIYKHKCRIDNVTTDAFIYFKFVDPAHLEYVVALEDKVETGEYLSKVYSVKL